MKFTTALPIVAAIAGTAMADAQIGPFRLQLTSTNAAYNNNFVSVCRTGADIFMFCLGGNGAGFFLNTTSEVNRGILVETFDYGTYNRSFALTLTPSLTSNLATSTIHSVQYAYQATTVGFDEKDLLYLDGGLDESKMPATPPVSEGKLYRWVACKTLGPYGGVTNTLAWLVGNGKSANPTCADVSVKRIKI
jgi:hypothetical protein